MTHTVDAPEPTTHQWNIVKYAEEHADVLKPPVCNAMVSNHSVLWLMLVGGPNVRRDYHLNRGEEVFIQVKGDMLLHVVEKGQEARPILIKEGQMFVLPSGIPHSPQRFENTVGIVLERRRKDHEHDGLRYYERTDAIEPSTGPAPDSVNLDNVVFQRYLKIENLGKQLAPVIKEYFASNAHKCNSRDEEDLETAQPQPWVDNHHAVCADPVTISELQVAGPRNRLWDGEFVVDLYTDCSLNMRENVDAVRRKTCIAWLVHVDGEAVPLDAIGLGDEHAPVYAVANDKAKLRDIHDVVLFDDGLESIVVSEGAYVLVMYSTAY